MKIIQIIYESVLAILGYHWNQAEIHGIPIYWLILMLGLLCLVMCFATPSNIKLIVTILGKIFLFPERVVGIRYIFALLVQTFDLIPYTLRILNGFQYGWNFATSRNVDWPQWMGHTDCYQPKISRNDLVLLKRQIIDCMETNPWFYGL